MRGQVVGEGWLFSAAEGGLINALRSSNSPSYSTKGDGWQNQMRLR
jgi:hypothetical protein